MTLTQQQLRFPSVNGVDTISGVCIYGEGPYRGIVQIVHGMCEYTQRYHELMEYLARQGFVVCGADHLGHGDSAGRNGFGYFAKEHGWQCLVQDARHLTALVRRQFPQLPCFLLGHSMGSFVSRAYMVKFGHDIQGVLLSGTGGSNPMTGIGIPLIKAIKKAKGAYYRSAFIDNMAFGSFNKSFAPARTAHDWLTRDHAQVDLYESDPRCGFVFTTSAYLDLMKLVDYVSGAKWASRVPKKLPVYLYSGDRDPVGGFGKGVREVYTLLAREQLQDVKIKLYPEGRHEMHNEINRVEVYEDILHWLEAHTA